MKGIGPKELTLVDEHSEPRMAAVKERRLRALPDGSERTRFWGAIDRSVLTVLVLGLLSTLLLLYSDNLWRTSFRKTVPVLDNIMQAKDSLAEAYLWLDELLKGNETIRITEILGFYDQAARAVDACLEGESVIRGMPGLPIIEGELSTDLKEFKASIEKARVVAEARWKNRDDTRAARAIDRNLQTAYHGLGLMAGAITATLEEDISGSMRTQRMVHVFTLCVWLTIISGAAAALLSASKRRKKSQQRLEIYQEGLRSLASELVLTEERERRRLATDLHDSIAQSLAISKTKLDALRAQSPSEDLSTALEEILEILKPAIRDARSLIFQLSPPLLYVMGLEAAVESLAEQTQEQHGLTTTFSDDNRPKPLGEDLRVLLFRAVRELLINVIKHSRAKGAKIRMRRDDGCIKIDVEDDGIGFNPAGNEDLLAGRTGFGLFSIRERLHQLDGRVEIDSCPGRGTRVTLTARLQCGEDPPEALP
jgi:signal transduction histidine kinase